MVPPLVEPKLRDVSQLPIKARHTMHAAGRTVHDLIRPSTYNEKAPDERAELRRQATRFVLQSSGALPPDQVEAFDHVYPDVEAEASALSDEERQSLEESTDLTQPYRSPHPAMVVLDHFRSVSRSREPADSIQATAALMINRYTT